MRYQNDHIDQSFHYLPHTQCSGENILKTIALKTQEITS